MMQAPAKKLRTLIDYYPYKSPKEPPPIGANITPPKIKRNPQDAGMAPSPDRVVVPEQQKLNPNNARRMEIRVTPPSSSAPRFVPPPPHPSWSAGFVCNIEGHRQECSEYDETAKSMHEYMFGRMCVGTAKATIPPPNMAFLYRVYDGEHNKGDIKQRDPSGTGSVIRHLINPHRYATQYISFCATLDGLKWVINDLKKNDWKESRKGTTWTVYMVHINLDDPKVLDIRDGYRDETNSKSAKEVLIERAVTQDEVVERYYLCTTDDKLDKQKQITAMCRQFKRKKQQRESKLRKLKFINQFS
jgi:hypothetical protein